jgi:hypothetical protein
MTSLEIAILGLRQALDSPRRHHLWRRLVRHRMDGVKRALMSDDRFRGGDAWLAARELSLHRDRMDLLRRISALDKQVAEAPDIDTVRGELHRLVGDLERHRQRLNDLVYDSVSLELGGSE